MQTWDAFPVKLYSLGLVEIINFKSRHYIRTLQISLGCTCCMLCYCPLYRYKYEIIKLQFWLIKGQGIPSGATTHPFQEPALQSPQPCVRCECHTLLGCFGFGLILMKTSSCSMRAVIHWGSTSMSSLMSNIKTRGKQPCGANQKNKLRNKNTFFCM